MKNRHILLILIFFAILSCFSLYPQSARIGVISDLHYTHPSLLKEKGKALNDYLSRDRKLLCESDAILRQVVNNLLQEEINIVLIPGDLTKDGEKVSHQGVAQLLKPLREKGVKILVVPGNHDINNPDAVSFHGDVALPVPTVSAEEFSDIYSDYGFASAISRDAYSLSYVSEPAKGLRVICIDACKYYDNTFRSAGAHKDSCVTNGAIKPETMSWIRTEMQVAKTLGKEVLVMMHHNVVEHFDYQGVFATPYLVDNYKQVQKQFLDFGIKVVFTGHFHSSDIAKVENTKGDTLYEIETGSIVTYPCPYRIIDVAGASLDIATKVIEHIDYDLPHGMSFQAYAASLIEVGFSEMLPSIIHEYHHNIVKVVPRWMRPFITVPDADRLSYLFTKHLSPAGVNMLLAHYAGNEHYVRNATLQKEELLRSVDNLIHDLAKESSGSFAAITEKLLHRMDIVRKAKFAVSSIWENTMTASIDNRYEKISFDKPMNDLYLSFNMQDAPILREKEESYTQHIQTQENNTIKSRLITLKPQGANLWHQYAVLDNRKKKYSLP